MTSIKLMLNRDRVLNSGKFPLVFQLIHKRKRKLIYTNYKLFEEEFDAQSEKMVYSNISRSGFSNSEVKKLNSHCIQERKRIEKIVVNFEQLAADYSVLDICNTYDLNVKSNKLLHYMNSRIEEKRIQAKDGIAAAYSSTRSSLSLFLKEKDINVNEVTPRFVREYDDFLRRRHVTDNTIAFYMRNFRTIYNRIVDEGFKPHCSYPFKSVKTSPAKTVKRALSKKALKSLMDMTFDKSEYGLGLSRDLFLFSFYTRGMTFVDISYLRYSDITDNAIFYRRQKTGQILSVGITPQLKEIIDKYYFADRELVMPVLNIHNQHPLYLQYRNALSRNVRNLKLIGERLNLPIKLTSYVARHSWANVAKHTGVELTVISEGLGHTSEQTTRIYLQQLDRSVLDKANITITKL